MDSINETAVGWLENIEEFKVFRNGWEGSYKIDFMENGKWKIKNLEALTIA